VTVETSLSGEEPAPLQGIAGQEGAQARVRTEGQADRGTHVNVSGGGVLKGAKNKANAVRLIEFLSGDFAQKLYAEQNFEYPVKPGAPVSPLVKSWGDFKADAINLAKVAERKAAASKLVDQVNFDGAAPRN